MRTIFCQLCVLLLKRRKPSDTASENHSAPCYIYAVTAKSGYVVCLRRRRYGKGFSGRSIGGYRGRRRH